MNELDPVLAREGGISVNDTDKGLFSSIPMKNIEVVAAYLQLVVDLSSNKEIKVLDVFNNARTIFGDDYIKSSDIYWKEHLAGTLREPFDRGFEANLLNALKHLPKREQSEDAAIFFKEVNEIKSFLNDYAHMNYSKALSYIQIRYPKAQEVTEEIFDRICKDLVDMLYKWFFSYCYKGAN